MNTEQNDGLREIEALVEVAESELSQFVGDTNDIIAQPRQVAELLLSWRLPTVFIHTALWSVVSTYCEQTTLLPPAEEHQVRLGNQLVKFGRLFSKQRRGADFEKYHTVLRTLRNDLWSGEFTILLIAIFLATIRQSAFSNNIRNKYKAMLAIQARAVFEPISAQLGLWNVHRELLELALKCEEPMKYEQAQEFALSFPGMNVFLEKVNSLVNQVETITGLTNLSIEIDHEPIYDVVQLMNDGKRVTPAQLVSFIIIVPHEQDCHRFVQELHRLGNPSKSYRDYINHPKKNRYRSIHTTISNPTLKKVRFRIRTPELHEISRYGILAEWWQGKRLFLEDTFVPNPPVGYLFVSTRRGKSYLMPTGSTVLDLAFHIGKGVGLRFGYGISYGLVKRLEAGDKLSDGDIVDIVSGPTNVPKPEWLNLVKSDLARETLKKFFEHEIGYNEKSTNPADSIEDLESDQLRIAIALPYELENQRIARCRQCNPYPPQNIVAHQTLRHDVTVHQASCRVIRDNPSILPVKWRPSAQRPRLARLDIEGWDRVGLLADIAGIISSKRINMSELRVETNTDETATFQIYLEARGVDIIQRICEKLRKVAGIERVTSSSLVPTGSPPLPPENSLAGYVNPYSPGPANPTVFYGRRNELRIIRRTVESFAGDSVLLWGQQRIGKTSLLQMLENDAKNSTKQLMPFFIDMQFYSHLGEQSKHHLTSWFAKELVKRRNRLAGKHRSSDVVLGNSLLHDIEVGGSQLINVIEQLSNDFPSRRILILVDEFQNISNVDDTIREEFLSRLIQLLSEYRKTVSFVFAGSGFASLGRTGNVLSPIMRWIAETVHLDVLDSANARKLIVQPSYPIRYDEQVIKKLLWDTANHPYYIVLICRELIKTATEPMAPRLVVTNFDLTRATAAILRHDSERFSHLLKLVPEGDSLLLEIAKHADIEERWINLDFLSRRALQYDQIKIRKIISDLVALSVLEQSGQDTQEYRIKIPLFQQWLKKNLL